MNDYTVDLETARTIVAGARAKGRDLQLEPLTVVVLDRGGHVVAVEREDESGIIRMQIASAKAAGALGMGFGSRELAKRAAVNPAFIDALSTIAPGGLLPGPGGVLIRRAEGGRIIGAVGISGDTGDRDEECAIAGITSAGLVADAG